ncbi:AbrB/MazE/SpoVT family DNA-binding domain-containing protein [uncultured Sphingomonas sp.]|uniref:AbrB/MazE/SpoVT family DNA-binding domain-containing protein n=1 Tax=uncultured Sphingomonas sp. TaxID=158754 RepID=UPI0035CA2D9B
MGKLTNMTVKGQVTIPKDVRDALGFKPNEPVEVEWSGGDEVVIRKPKLTLLDDDAAFEAELARLKALAERWKHLRTGVDTDEYMAELREPLPMPHPDDV